MSFPHFSINSLTYSAPVLTLDMQYRFIRGGGSFQINGFSSSIPFSISGSDAYSDIHTFSVPTLGTSSTTSYISPSATITFGGTPSFNGATTSNTNLQISVAGQQLSSVTASTSVLSTFLNTVVGSFVFSGAASGYSATSSGTAITFAPPLNTGNSDNGVAVTVVTSGTGSFTTSGSTTFTGGFNVNNISLVRTNGWTGGYNYTFNT